MKNGNRNRTLAFGRKLSSWLYELLDWLPQSLVFGGGLGLAITLVLTRSVGFTRVKPKDDSVRTSADLLTSSLNDEARTRALVILLASMGLWVTGSALAVIFWRRHAIVGSFRDRFVELNRRCLPIALLPLVTYLVVNRNAPRFDQLDLTVIALFSTVSGIYAYRAFEGQWLSWLRRFQPKTERTGFIVLLMLWVLYSSWASYTSIIEHWNLGTRVFDLGVYGNTVYNTSQGRLLECAFTARGTHISAHFDPILILISPIYWLYPRVESLLVLQSFWLGAAAIPLYFYSRRNGLAIGEALVVCSAYLLLPALHGVNFFGFHSLALMVPLVVCMLYWLEAEKYLPYFATTLLLLTVREDQSLIVTTIGFYALVTRRAKIGVLTLLLAAAYAVFAKIITSKVLGPGGARTYEYYYGEVMMAGGNGAVDLAVSVLSNPLLAFATILKLPKIYYFLKLLVPLCFFPLLGGRKVWLLAYGFLFIGLSSRTAVPTVHYQYSALLLPFVMVAAIDGMKRVFGSKLWLRFGDVERPMRRAIFGAILAGSLGTSLTFGAWPTNPGFYAGRTPLQRRYGSREAARRHQLLELESRIPADARICVDSNLGPHLSNNQFISTLPKCRGAQYVLSYKGRHSAADRAALRKLKTRGVQLYDDADFVFLELNQDHLDADPQSPDDATDGESGNF